MEKTQEIFYLARQVELRYELDKYEQSVLEAMRPSLIKAREDVLKKIDAIEKTSKLALFEPADQRMARMLLEFEAMVSAVSGTLEGTVRPATENAYLKSAENHFNTLSVFGTIEIINNVSLSKEQLASFWTKTPGDLPFAEWISRTYGTPVIAATREKIGAGYFTGKGYEEMRTELINAFVMAEDNADTLIRTWIQTANVEAQRAVYEANKDVVNQVEWSAVLENGYLSTGRGTCLRCAALDSQKWPIDSDKIPPIPLHARCKCVLLPITKSWRELGVNMDEIAGKVKPYTIRPDVSRFGDAGVRTILKAGQSNMSYADWIVTQSADIQRQMMGPNRYELIKSGKVKFRDLIKKNGKLKTLEELKNKEKA